MENNKLTRADSDQLLRENNINSIIHIKINGPYSTETDRDNRYTTIYNLWSTQKHSVP